MIRVHFQCTLELKLSTEHLVSDTSSTHKIIINKTVLLNVLRVHKLLHKNASRRIRLTLVWRLMYFAGTLRPSKWLRTYWCCSMFVFSANFYFYFEFWEHQSDICFRFMSNEMLHCDLRFNNEKSIISKKYLKRCKILREISWYTNNIILSYFF